MGCQIGVRSTIQLNYWYKYLTIYSFCIYVLKGHTSTIRCLKVLHNRPIAVTGSRDRTLRVWDIRRGRLLRVLEGHEQSVRSLDVYGNKVVSGSYDSTCRLWNIDTGECIHILRGHYNQIYSVAYDGVRIVSGGMDTTVRVWDAESG
jgi:F-box and WD-40 domain protein CDC4